MVSTRKENEDTKDTVKHFLLENESVMTEKYEVTS